MGKTGYSSESKWVFVKDKTSSQLTNKEIMEKQGIKKVAQIKVWMKWFRNKEIHRFDQPIGKQYTFGHRSELGGEWERKGNEERIRKKLGYLAPKEFGAQAA